MPSKNLDPLTSKLKPIVSAVRNSLGVAMLAAPLLVFPDIVGAAIVPATDEQVVNSETSSNQGYPSMAVDADGDFVVVWESYGQDGDNYGIYGQRYNAAGETLGGEFPVNTYTTHRQYDPSVAMDADGDFVVVWTSDGKGNGEPDEGQDGDFSGIYGQRYNAAGETLGDEFLINTYTTGRQNSPSVAMDADGDFMVVWQGFGQDGDYSDIYGQRYNAVGVPQGSEFPVNSYTTGYQDRPSVAMDADGDFMVVWEGEGQDGSDSDIYGQRYNAVGVPQGSEFPVNSFTADYQQDPSVAMDADGDFVVVWHSSGQDGNNRGVYGQRYNAAGETLDGEFPVNIFTTGFQGSPSVAMDADGDFVVGWTSFGQDEDVSDSGVFARTYRANGTPDQSAEFNVSQETEGDQMDSAVAMDDNGDIAIAWSSGRADPTPVGRSDSDVILRTFSEDVIFNDSFEDGI